MLSEVVSGNGICLSARWLFSPLNPPSGTLRKGNYEHLCHCTTKFPQCKISQQIPFRQLQITDL